MVMLRFLRPVIGIVGKQSFIGNSQMTKWRYFAQDAAQIASCSIEEFLNKHEISINGKNMENLRPILNFEETNFPDPVIRALKSKFDAPSVIQSVSWPAVLAGRDLVGIARTGSGKTLSFMLPALVHISKQEQIKRGDGPIVLILCPTRELAQQVQAVASEWGNMLTRVRTMCAYGGANRMPQELKLHQGVEIVVATPGRLNDFLSTGATNMKRCSYLVLDEADRMLDMGFEPQIRAIIDQINKKRQTLMYSATWPNEVRNLAGDFMKDYVQVKIGSAELSANKNITQIVHVTTSTERDKKFWDLLHQLLERDPSGKILVFCLQKVMTNRLEYRATDKGLAAAAIHGDKSQIARDRCLTDFRSGATQILFATDVAARGLDVNDIKYVVNYDHPFCAEDYVHRIGRTARRDQKGESHTFLTEEDAGERARDLIKVLEASDQLVSDELKRLANTRSTSSKQNVRRWGVGSHHGSPSPFGFDRSRSTFSRDRFSSFSDHRRPERRNRYDRHEEEDDVAPRRGSRYDRYEEQDDEIAPRRTQSGQNRYFNVDNRRQQRSRYDQYEEEEEDDVAPRRNQNLNRYNNVDSRRQQLSYRRRDADMEDDDGDFDFSDRGAPRRR